jgi:hypothetical protein
MITKGDSPGMFGLISALAHWQGTASTSKFAMGIRMLQLQPPAEHPT